MASNNLHAASSEWASREIHAMRLAVLPTSFERGWDAAIALWKDGITWEAITHYADRKDVEQAYEYARGMRASVEAMSGWLDSARRAAKADAISTTTIEALIIRAQKA
jgi:hypothetical protein